LPTVGADEESSTDQSHGTKDLKLALLILLGLNSAAATYNEANADAWC